MYKEMLRRLITSQDKRYSVALELTTPACVRDRWAISIQNGEWKKPVVEFQTLDEALLFMQSALTPEQIQKVYDFLAANYKFKPFSPEEVYQGTGLMKPEHEKIIPFLRELPELAFYIRQLPDLSSLSPEERSRIEAERVCWP